jgi:hypothetical protein
MAEMKIIGKAIGKTNIENNISKNLFGNCKRYGDIEQVLFKMWPKISNKW